ncbi:MAG: ribonuclease Z, partial [Clostridiaceae bacterium]|nr:ribonuclease Z [Clostridiaceae bacterium]
KGHKLLIDCGEGTQVSMKMCGTGFKTIDYILISHCHGDHILGLPGLLQTIGNSGREDKITIIGPQGIKEVMEGLMVTCKYLPYDVEVIENPKESISIFDDDLIISTVNADHNIPCLGYSLYFKRSARFDVAKAEENKVPKNLWNKLQKSTESIEFEGKTYKRDMVLGRGREGLKIGYITDSRPLESMKEFYFKCDMLFCEGTYGDDLDLDKAIKNKHMTFREAATLAKSADCKELCLTHFSVAMMEPKDFLANATSVFQNTKACEDRMKFSLKFPED